MARNFDRAPIDRRKQPVDASIPEEEPITEKIAERKAQPEAFQSENAALGGKLIHLADFRGQKSGQETLGNRPPSDPTDFNSVSKLFADLVRRMQDEGRSTVSIDAARQEFAEAAAAYAKHMGEVDPDKKAATAKEWQRVANRAFSRLPISVEEISWDAPDARMLDVPVSDCQFIHQMRSAMMGLDGKIEPWVHLEITRGAPVDVQRRFYVSRQREALHKDLARQNEMRDLFREYRDRVYGIAVEHGVDKEVLRKAMEEADRLYDQQHRAFLEALTEYTARIIGLQDLSDAQIAGHDSIHEVTNRSNPQPALQRSEQARMAAMDRLSALVPKSAEAQ